MGATADEPRQAGAAGQYGADLTRRQYALVVTALCIGTTIEWYEFFAYSQLAATLTALFFPPGNPALATLSFWGVFFVGFLARPIGSLLFGSIGDTKGRRLVLLLTILVMSVPTVLIGCLPTYAQAGIAAPILLALLRLVQGLGLGGEFGSALVYLHELAPPARQTLMGAVGFASSILGCFLGVAVVMALEAAATPAQILAGWWRLPFLLSAFSAAFALVLRLRMPESQEFLAAREQALQVNREHIAATRLASLSSAGSRQLHVLHARTLPRPDAPSASHPASSTALSPAASSAGAQSTEPPQQPQQQRQLAADGKGTLAGGAPRAVLVSEAEAAYSPVLLLLRKHSPAVLLQWMFEAWPSICFYTITTWLPSVLQKAGTMSARTSQAMLLVNFVVIAAALVAAGAAADRGLPRVVSCLAVYAAAAAVAVPVSAGFGGGDTAAQAWLLHALLMAMVGWVLGVVPAACSNLYPPTVRTSGFNLGHNLAMSWLGGLSPTVLSAMGAHMAPLRACGVWLAAAAGVSVLAALVLLWYCPAANRSRPRQHKTTQGEAIV